VLRLLAAAFVAMMALFGYCAREETNPVTGESQRVALDAEQEVALGAQAAPRLAAQYGGPDPDPAAQALVDRLGRDIVARTAAGETPYRFEFHVLDDEETLNAFALPGGQVFVTMGLLRALGAEDRVAGVLAHEVAHVVARHGAEQLAQRQLAQGLAGAATIATYDPDNPGSAAAGAIASAIATLVDMRFSREDELEADALGVRLLAEAGRDPRGLLEALDVLSESSAGVPAFFSTHPNPEDRAARLRDAIDDVGAP
jgi:beta-barrel assembly-enhancing protease